MDPIESLRDFRERASTLEWAVFVVAVMAVIYVLGLLTNKLFGPKRKDAGAKRP
jgi:hypothetical protein